MWDPNTGLWVDDVYRSAGPSGGATGALDLMNTMQSGQNYNQEHSAKMLAVLSQLLSNPNAPALTSNPMAATATDMTPDQVQQAYQQTPRGQFSNYTLNNPNASQADLYAEQARLNMVPPSSLGAQVRQQSSDQNKWQRELAALGVKQRHDVVTEAAKYAALGYEDPIGQALADYKSAGSGQETAPQAGQAPTVAATVGLKKATADYIKGPKTGLTQSQTALNQTRNTWLPLLDMSIANRNNAGAGHLDAMTAGQDLANELKAQEATDALTPQGRQALMQKAASASAQLVKLQNDPNTQAILRKGGPQADQTNMLMKGMAAAIQAANARVSSAPSVKITTPARVSRGAETPTAQPQGVSPPQYKSVKEFVDAFIKDQGRAPSDTEIARAKGVFYP
jgi:hypothetical protein